MYLSHYYFSVGGEFFDADGFSKIAAIEGARVFKTNTVKRFTAGTGEVSHRKLWTGVTGTGGDSFYTWQTPKMIYMVSREDYLAAKHIGMIDQATLWLKEEAAILQFLAEIGPALGEVPKFCGGESFSILKLIYGHEEGALAGGGTHYSERLIKRLAEFNANLSTDSISWPEEFCLDE